MLPTITTLVMFCLALFTTTMLMLTLMLMLMLMPLSLLTLTPTSPLPHPLLNRNLKHLAPPIKDTNLPPLLTNLPHQPLHPHLLTLKHPLPLLSLHLKPLKTPTPIKAHLHNPPTDFLLPTTHWLGSDTTIGIGEDTTWVATQITYSAGDVR
jgi:hypothetical protein